ncbi:hypothetical protein Q3G72_029626 [Acer saccharum]|nr:hypothetical protein Q3G72_029626 [Acer saccharum]
MPKEEASKSGLSRESRLNSLVLQCENWAQVLSVSCMFKLRSACISHHISEIQPIFNSRGYPDFISSAPGKCFNTPARMG